MRFDTKSVLATYSWVGQLGWANTVWKYGNKKPGFCPGCCGLRYLDSTALWTAETVRVQDLRIADVDDARIVVEKLHGNFIRNF